MCFKCASRLSEHKTELAESFFDERAPIDLELGDHRSTLLKKIKRKDLHEIKKCTYDIMCTLAKLLECEVMIKKKIQRQIQKFHARIIGAESGKNDLQISELFATMDSKNEGKINKA